jgi:LacI family transcriptional regulator
LGTIPNQLGTFLAFFVRKMLMSDTKLTLVDIAKLAGVSRSTVSRVVNNHPNVRPNVRHRVQEIIEQTGYQPNVMARSLRSQCSDIVGLVIPETVHTLFTDPYFPALTQGVAQACNHCQKTLALFIEREDQSLVEHVTREGLLGGVIIQTGKIGSRLISDLHVSEIPFLVLGRPHDDLNGTVNYLDVDNRTGAYRAVAHLLGLGRRRIGTITGSLDTTTGVDRRDGYINALRERSIKRENRLIVEGDYTELGGYYAAQSLLPNEPDAIFAASDAMGRGAVRAIQEAGLSVPEDIAIVGFDDLPPAIVSHPHLTTMRQPIRHFGFKAVEMLSDIIEYGPDPARRVVMDVELVIRESCGSTIVSM